MGFLFCTSLPSLDWLDVDYTLLEEDVIERAAELEHEPFGDEIQHRIGGYPGEIQSGQLAIQCEYLRRNLERDDSSDPAAIRRAARQWRLLLQVDSDPALGMNWGDGGRLYVFVREPDARAGDFSQTVTIAQSH